MTGRSLGWRRQNAISIGKRLLIIKSRVTKMTKKKTRNPLSAQCSSVTQRPTCQPRCKQSSKDDGVKNEITMKECCALILVVKLKRTDTTLDLSQKARVVKNLFTRSLSLLLYSSPLLYPGTDRSHSGRVYFPFWLVFGSLAKRITINKTNQSIIR